jgi:5-hydroxyisourate hydrolase-like protein (transthyretin family)
VLAQVSPVHAAGGAPLQSPITTHALDTALGCPAQGLPLKLMKLDAASNCWDVVATGTTNHDGRVPALLPPSNTIAPGRCVSV